MTAEQISELEAATTAMEAETAKLKQINQAAKAEIARLKGESSGAE